MKQTEQYKNSDWHDLYYTVQFSDGSVWSDRFKRHLEYKPKLDGYYPTNKFLNDFLPGADLMTQTKIKQGFKQWVQEVNPDDNNIKIKWEIA